MEGRFLAALSPHIELLQVLHRLAVDADQPVWLAGGTLRDLLLGRRPPDVDLAVAGDALALGRSLAREAGARYVGMDEEHATCRVVRDGRWLDLASLRAADLAGDLAARDFTVNAMALSLADLLAGSESVIDPTGGREDLAAMRLRPAGPGVLRDDPLRVLRAFRFLSTHGLTPDPPTMGRLAGAAPGLAHVAKERVGHEWRAMMAGDSPGLATRGLDAVGGLALLVPDLEAGRGMGQNPYHHLDVRAHSMACLEALDDIAAQPERHMAGLAGEVADYLTPPRRRAVLMTAGLLHDLGKPPTRAEKSPGWASFHRHDIQGAEMARAACRELGFSGADAGLAAKLIRAHMRPFFLMGARRKGVLSARGVRRLLAAAGEDLPGLMALALADTMAGKGPERPPQAEEELVALYGQVAEMRDRELAAALAAPPLVGGNEVMAATGMNPGPKVGRLLARLREAQLDGQITTPAQALDLARRLAERDGE